MRLINNFILIFLMIVSDSSLGVAQGPEQYLTLKPVLPQKVRPGESNEILIEMEILDPYHIQANPAANPRLIPSTLSLEAVSGITANSPIYPPGKRYRLKQSQESLSVYSGKLVLKVPITVSAVAKLKSVRLRGKFRFQPCNDSICFFPVSLPIEIPIEIEKKN